jgi:chromosome segregation ATPase
MYQQLELKDQELEELSRIVEENERREEHYIHEINSYQRQLENLTQDFESVQDEARRLSGEKDILRAERNWKKEVSSLTQDWRTKQEERFVDLQQDYHHEKVEKEQMKQKCRQL